MAVRWREERRGLKDSQPLSVSQARSERLRQNNEPVGGNPTLTAK